MKCRLMDIREKQVICVRDGTIIGCLYDVIVDTCSGRIVSIVILGRSKFFGLFGRCEDIIIPWDSIQVMGEETILVDFETPRQQRRGFLGRRNLSAEFPK